MNRVRWAAPALLAALLLLAGMFAGRSRWRPNRPRRRPPPRKKRPRKEQRPRRNRADAPAAEVVATDAVTDTVTSAYVSLDLAAGFPLDPFLVSVNGGGSVDASQFGEGCTGFVNEAPTVSLNWEGETDFVEAFFYSASDPVMVVQTPAGDYLCSDDANEMLLDPVIEMAQPANGRYNIWVGSYTPEQLIPGLLVLTTRSEINLGTFDLASLVQRTPIPEDVLEPEEVAPPSRDRRRSRHGRHHGRGRSRTFE
ncbi:MAG: hypothetical protein R2854_17960 [Caldilineaceae bacterium]